MNSMLIDWNTSRYIHDRIRNYRFLRQFEQHNKEIFDIYTHLDNIDIANYNRYESDYSGSLKTKFIGHLDRMFEFEKFLETSPTAQEIGEKALSLFDNRNIFNVKSINMLEVKRMDMIEEYCLDIHVLFNAIENLSSFDSKKVSSELRVQINEILVNKGLDHFTIQEELLLIPKTEV